MEDYLHNARLEPYTIHSITCPKELRRVIEKAREDGYAQDLEETEEGLRCLAAPVFDFGGKPVASVSISGAAARMERNFVDYLVQLRGTTAKISQKLGYSKYC